MFSHESIPLIILFIIMLIGVVTAFLHPVHALCSWLRNRRGRASSHPSKKMDPR